MFAQNYVVTPLTTAVLVNDKALVATLIENGALLDYRTRLGDFSKFSSFTTALQNSTSSNSFHSGGGPASPLNTRATFTTGFINSEWLTPLHVAASENRVTALQVLLFAGASPNVLDSQSLSPLYHAVLRGHSECARWLLIWSSVNYREAQPGIDLQKQQDSMSRNLIHIAGMGASAACLKLLLEYGGSSMINSVNIGDNTALHLLCSKPNATTAFKDCAKLLLEWGIDREIKNKSGQTAAQLALMSGNIELSDYIKKWTLTSPATILQPPPFYQIVERDRAEWFQLKKTTFMSMGSKITMSNMHQYLTRTLEDCDSKSTLGTTGALATFTNPDSARNSVRGKHNPSRLPVKSMFSESSSSIGTANTETTNNTHGEQHAQESPQPVIPSPSMDEDDESIGALTSALRRRSFFQNFKPSATTTTSTAASSAAPSPAMSRQPSQIHDHSRFMSSPFQASRRTTDEFGHGSQSPPTPSNQTPASRRTSVLSVGQTVKGRFVPPPPPLPLSVHVPAPESQHFMSSHTDPKSGSIK